MKTNTAVMLIHVMRNVRGIITVFERWVKQEGKIGTVSISNSSHESEGSVDGEDSS